jgi:SAM-dependent methyltransferase
MTGSSSLFDQKRIARNRQRAQARFPTHDFLHRRVWQALIERSQMIQRTFEQVIVHANLIPKGVLEEVAYWQVNPKSNEPTNLDLLVSALELHLIDDLPAQLRQCRSVLKPDGVFLAALFGGHTLSELRQCLLAAEAELTGGVYARIIPFVEVRSLGALVQQAGFALPVIDVETITVRYSSLQDLLHDLRYMGEGNPMTGPIRPLTRALLRRTEDIYREKFGDTDGRLPARFDILHICGWAPDASQPRPLKPGSGQMFLGDALKTSRK